MRRALRVPVATVASRRGALLMGAAVLVAGCGSMPAQDEDEPVGEFRVDVARASFPEQQKLAKDSQLEIAVENAGEETVPNINVTLGGFDRKERDPLNPNQTDPSLADPSRPVFVVDKSPIEFLRDRSGPKSLVDREVNPPEGRDTAYVNTYSLGPLEEGDTAVFRWNVSAVEAGPYRLTYEVNAGLDGKALAVTEDGEQPTGTFSGTIEDAPPAARVADDGETIVTEDGRRIEDQRGVKLKGDSGKSGSGKGSGS